MALPKRKRRVLKAAGIGCGVLAGLVVLLMSIVYVQFTMLSRRAVETREQVERSFPTQADFTPWLDDAVPPERLERFIAVRRELQPMCEEFAVLRGGFEGMDRRAKALDEQPMDDEATKEELKALTKEGGGVLWSMVKLGRNLGRYSVARNEALIRNEIGLGEYTWIYAVAYYSWLGHRPQRFPIAKEAGPRIFQDRVLGQIWAMAGRHVQELESSPGDASSTARIAAWRAEMAAGSAGSGRIPFQDGLPEWMAASLQPRRAELESLFCPETTELDVMRTEKERFKYEHR